mgnify:CR=1 FL=1
MKRFILLIIITLVLTGCSRIDSNIDNIVAATMKSDINNVNTVSTSYKLYIPVGVMQLVDNEYNQKFKIKDTYVYLYVDTVSYYYKNNLNYKVLNEYDYYYKEIRNNDKEGYIGISKTVDDNYFVEIVYNYSKIEFYVNETDMPVVMANSLIIINSIEYNDTLIKLEYDALTSNGSELTYELDKPVDSESMFSQYLQEYVAEEDVEIALPDAE